MYVNMCGILAEEGVFCTATLHTVGWRTALIVLGPNKNG